MSDTPDQEPLQTRPLRRAGFFLLVILVLGLPVMVAGGLINADLDLHATVGSQPGGLIEGRIVPRGDWGEQAQALRGHAIELYVLNLVGERDQVAVTQTGPEGEFAFDAPPVEGKYQLVAGGGLWQRVLRESSFLDREGELVESRTVELPLRRGCSLEINFIDPAGAPAISGTYDLSGELEEGAILGLIHPRFRRESEFEDGLIKIDGLPPLEGTLRVFFGVGESLSLDILLEPGETKRRVEL